MLSIYSYMYTLTDISPSRVVLKQNKERIKAFLYLFKINIPKKYKNAENVSK